MFVRKLSNNLEDVWYEKGVLFFSAFLFFTLAIHIFLLVLRCGNQLDLYWRGEDLWADFLNPVRYAANRDPYFDETNEPKWHNQTGVFYILSWAVARIAKSVGVVTVASLSELYQHPILMVLTSFYLMFCVFAIGHSLWCLTKKTGVNQIIVPALVLSAPVLFTIERGNDILFSSACIIYFIAFYDSTNKKKRLFACLCLAMAASLKIYPVLFGMLYFEKKQFKEIFVSAAMTIFLFFSPFLFFKHGFDNFGRLLWIESYWASEAYNFALWDIVEKIICVFFLILSLFQKKLFYRLVCVTYPFLMLSAFQAYYLLLYYLPLAVLLFSESRHSINLFFKIYFLFHFTFLFTPLQILKYIIPQQNRNINMDFYFITKKYFFVIIFIVMLVETLIRFLSEHKRPLQNGQ